MLIGGLAILFVLPTGTPPEPDRMMASLPREGNACALDPRARKTLDDILRPRHASVHVAARHTRTSRELPTGATERVERTDFVRPVGWTGLPLAAVQLRIVQNPESEGMGEWSFIFALTPSRLRSALTAIGKHALFAPVQKSMMSGEEGVVNIMRQGDKAALTCSWDG